MKKCDLIIANKVSEKNGVMGGDVNSAYIFNNSCCLQKYLNIKKDVLSEKVLTEVIFLILNKKINKVIKIIYLLFYAFNRFKFRKRYSRNILLPEIGGIGQQKLLESKVLVIGAGG